ncbi:MAG: hypothetical protein ABIE36_02735 [Candidatus Diapherotrites archaeon]
MINKRVNKKADIPVTILVIGVFAVCVLALIIFLNSSHYAGKYFAGINLIEEAKARIEAGSLNHLYLDKRKTKFDIEIGEGGISFFKEKIIFSVEYNP